MHQKKKEAFVAQVGWEARGRHIRQGFWSPPGKDGLASVCVYVCMYTSASRIACVLWSSPS